MFMYAVFIAHTTSGWTTAGVQPGTYILFFVFLVEWMHALTRQTVNALSDSCIWTLMQMHKDRMSQWNSVYLQSFLFIHVKAQQ